MKGGLAAIVLVGAFIIAAEGACTFNKWDSLDGIPFFYNSDGNKGVRIHYIQPLPSNHNLIG